MEFEVSRDSISGHGMTVSYLRRKGSIPIVLLHGLGGRGNNWLRLVPKLSSKWDIIMPDLIGHGHSEKQGFNFTIKDQEIGMAYLIRELGLNDFILGGHSYGGWVALRLSVDMLQPKAIVLEDSAGINPTVGESGPEGQEAFVRKVMRMNPLNSEEIIRGIVRSNATGKEKLAKQELERIKCRTEIIWGTEDTIIPVRYAIELANSIGSSNIHRINGAGHVPHWTHPDEVAAIINSLTS
ncbi:MAG: alpha/beta hydrolase [Thermoplasmataceae archaeon]